MSIRLSEKHGVNPTMPRCFYCQEAKNMVMLVGRLPGDREAPKDAVWDMEPCDTCKDLMQAGVICISVDEGKTKDPKNPWRTGGWIVIKDDAIQRIFTGAVVRQVLEQRVAFLPDEVWDAVGFPRGPIEGVASTMEEYRRQQS